MDSQDDFHTPTSPVAQLADNENAILGLDQQLKPGRKVKIAKIDDERILGNKGLSYIVKNHQKVSRIFAKHDKALAKRLRSKSLSSAQKKQLKYDNEFDNMSTLLNFYQLWCHTMFPKANFKDCIQMIRGVAHRSPKVRIYRRELLDQEIYKMKVKNGIIDVPLEDQEEQQTQEGENIESTEANANTADDDDWSFMNPVIPPNSLFVDDDLYTTPPDDLQTRKDAQYPPEGAVSTTDTSKNAQHGVEDDLDQLEEEFYLMDQSHRNNDEDDYDLQLLNEMGM